MKIEIYQFHLGVNFVVDAVTMQELCVIRCPLIGFTLHLGLVEELLHSSVALVRIFIASSVIISYSLHWHNDR